MKQLIYGFYTLTGSLFLTILLFTIGLPFLIWYSVKLTYHIYKNGDKVSVESTFRAYNEDLPF